jgi:hypothetical protein
MKDFENKLQEQLDLLPFTKGLDDGQYNDGQQAGFEKGARWAIEEINKGLIPFNQITDQALAVVHGLTQNVIKKTNKII